MMTRALLLAGVGLIRCGVNDAQSSAIHAQDASDVDVQTAPIQAGTSDSGHPAVGLVWFVDGGFCSGTLIAPNVVLTAGHCVREPIAAFLVGAGKASSGTSEPPDNMVSYPVDQWLAHPDYESGTCPNVTPDIGLVRLAQPINDIDSMPYNKGAPPKKGKTCTIVGFGTHTERGGDQYGEKRKGTSVVRAPAEKTSISVKRGTALADSGDSGGPLLCGGVVAGTTSCHTDGDWPEHKTEEYARVDTVAGWIAETVDTWQQP